MLRNVWARGPAKWCAVIVLALLPGLWFVSLDNKNGGLNAGLTAAQAGDYKRALALWLPLARQGSAEAQFRLGWLFETGIGADPDFRTSAHWYSRAAAQSHAHAQYKLGLYSFHGVGLPQSDVKAANYFFDAAKMGHAKAQYSLGVMYQTGRGLPKDLHKAHYWFRRAKSNGYVSQSLSVRT